MERGYSWRRKYRGGGGSGSFRQQNICVYNNGYETPRRYKKYSLLESSKAEEIRSKDAEIIRTHAHLAPVHFSEKEAYAKGEFLLSEDSDAFAVFRRSDLEFSFEKEGSRPINLVTNNYPVDSRLVRLYQFSYLVHEQPTSASPEDLKSLLTVKYKLGYCLFDDIDNTLLTTKKIAYRMTPSYIDQDNWRIKISLVKELEDHDKLHAVYYQNVIRSIFDQMKLVEINGVFYNPSMAYERTLDSEIWPGFCARFGISHEGNRFIRMDLAPELFLRCHHRGLEGMQHTFKLDESRFNLEKHIKRVDAFRKQLADCSEINAKLTDCGLSMDMKVINCKGRVLPPPTLSYFDKNSVYDMEPKNMSLKMWGMILPIEDYDTAGNVTADLIRVAQTQWGIEIAQPRARFTLLEVDTLSYLDAIDVYARACSRFKIEMVVIVLKIGLELDIDAIIQQTAKCEFLTQYISYHDFLNLTSGENDGGMHITDLAMQIGVKLGLEPWTVDLCLHETILIAIDFNAETSLIGVVASYNEALTQYFSTSCVIKEAKPSWKIVWNQISKCLNFYQEKTGMLPYRVFIYRNGVTETDLVEVKDMELIHIKDSLFQYYAELEEEEYPLLMYTIVDTAARTRVYEYNGNDMKWNNPPVGTVIDSKITLEGEHDFYLVGSDGASPSTLVHYNVLHNSLGISLYEVEMLTYKFCRLDFGGVGGCGRLGIPAPCEYVHMLLRGYGSTGTGIGLKGDFHCCLSDKLHYL